MFGRIGSFAYESSSNVVSYTASTCVSAVSLAANTSKNAVVLTAQSLGEASLYAFDTAHESAQAVFFAEPAFDHSSAPSSHLSPFDRSLVTVCPRKDEAKHLDAPVLMTLIPHCRQCSAEFGLTCFRYPCGYCSESFCRDHIGETKIIRIFNKSTPSRVCPACFELLKRAEERDGDEWRHQRVLDFLDGKLIRYYTLAVDTALHKVYRAAHGTLAAAQAAPLGATAKMAVVSADLIRRYGRTGILSFVLRNEFVESFSTLQALIGNLSSISVQDAMVGMYYLMGSNRALRGENPYAERMQHQHAAQVCTSSGEIMVPTSDQTLKQFRTFAPLSLHAIYEEDPVDVQRISKLQDFTMIYLHESADISEPAFGLFVHEELKIVALIIRGSKSVHDIITDLRAIPKAGKGSSTTSSHQNNTSSCRNVGTTESEKVKPEVEGKDEGINRDLYRGNSTSSTADGSSVNTDQDSLAFDVFAHDGIFKAASWIKNRVVQSLLPLQERGYKVAISGHSLGGGCAALVSVMLKPLFPTLECYTYGMFRSIACSIYYHETKLCQNVASPACANANMAAICEDYVHSIILRDDFVPRLKSKSVRKLVCELIEHKNIWSKMLPEDFSAMKARATKVWAPRKREWAQQDANSLKQKNTQEWTSSASASHHKTPGTSIEWSTHRGNLMEQYNSSLKKDNSSKKNIKATAEEAVEVNTELFVPGSIYHIYFVQGRYETVQIARDSPVLSHISVQEDMLSNHLSRNYIQALRQIHDARQPNIETPPDWIPFSTKTRCMCCDSPFTWNSTSSSEAQLNQDQHNCRSCGMWKYMNI